MNHLVLARKYRPKLFEEVVGQDVIVATLKAALVKNRMAHALLFTGGRGIGKTTIARIVAKALVCLNRQEAEPCGLCVQCLSIDNFSSLDVIEIDGASHTGVDDVRDLRDSARYQPTSAKYKIFIIDEVHMLSTSAFNALLKIVEEPPPHVIFMFATTEAHKIPKTILSRCQRYDFKRMSIELIYKALKAIMVQEDIKFEDAGLLLIAELADGGMRDALSMSEQILAQKRDYYSALDVANTLGVVGHQAIKEVAEAIIVGQVEPALKVLSQVYEQGLDLCQMMDALTERFRVLSLCAHLDDLSKAKNIIPGLLEQDFLASKTHDQADLKRLFSMALDGMTQVFQARKPLLALELFILRVALRPPISDATTINFCLQKLEAIVHNRPLPKELATAKVVPTPAPLPVLPTKPSVERAEPISRPEHTPKASDRAPSLADPQATLSPSLHPGPAMGPSEPAKSFDSSANPRARHPEPDTGSSEPAKNFDRQANISQQFQIFVEDLAKSSPGLASYLRHARPHYGADHTLSLSFELSLYYEKLLQQKNNPDLKAKLLSAFGPTVKLELVLDKASLAGNRNVKTVAESEEAEKIADELALRNEASEHPLVKKALEIFGGNIAEVKRLDTHDVA